MIGSLCTLIDMHRSIFFGFLCFVLLLLLNLSLPTPRPWTTSNINNDEQKKYTMQIEEDSEKKITEMKHNKNSKLRFNYSCKWISLQKLVGKLLGFDDLKKCSVFSTILIGNVTNNNYSKWNFNLKFILVNGLNFVSSVWKIGYTTINFIVADRFN